MNPIIGLPTNGSGAKGPGCRPGLTVERWVEQLAEQQAEGTANPYAQPRKTKPKDGLAGFTNGLQATTAQHRF